MGRRASSILLLLLIPAAFLAGRLASPPGGGEDPVERKVLYWVDPMNPSYRSPEPGTAPCGMPLEPVYAEGPGPAGGQGADAGAVPVRGDRLQLIGVAREQVRPATIREVLRLVGTVAADETRLYAISAATPGRALEMGPVTTGSFVAHGEILGAYYAQELIVPQQNFVRLRDAAEALRRGGSNPYDNIQGGSQLATYERNLLYARQTLLNLGMSPEQIEEVVARREVSYMVQIRAPAAGIVLARRLTLGQSFDVGEELFRIADLERVWVLADALEGEERLFVPGTPATVTLPGTGQVFSAVVSQVLPQFEAATRTLKVRFEARNPGFVLRPDMFVDVELPIEIGPGLFLPKAAVLDSGTRQVVFVETGPGVFLPRAVRTGRRVADRVQILAGLMEGETVVTSGNFLLDSESRMRAAGAEAAAASAAIDPICGMEVEEAEARAAGLVSEHGGRTWFFCSPQCRLAFERDPRPAVARALPASGAGPARRDPAASPGPMSPGGGTARLPAHAARTPAAAATMPPAPPAEGAEGMRMPMPAAALAEMAHALRGNDGGGSLPHVPGGMPGGLPGMGRDEGPEDGAPGWQTLLPVPRDPVCGMEVDQAAALAAGLVSTYRGETYYFCVPTCKKEFDDNPVVFVQTSR